MPFLTYANSYSGYSFREPWNSSGNQKLGPKLANITDYACPAHSQSSEMTNYVAVVGENTLWRQPEDPKAYECLTVGEDVYAVRWPLPQGVKPPRDSGKKVIVVELVDSDIPWMEPRDVTLDEFIESIKNDPEGKFYNKHVNGIRAIDISGSVVVIDPYDDIEKIKNMFVVTGAE